jgi:hypothetical protein
MAKTKVKTTTTKKVKTIVAKSTTASSDFVGARPSGRGK